MPREQVFRNRGWETPGMDLGEALGAWWAPALAFVAGLVSFASPCVLPLVPGYLSFVSGGQAETEPATTEEGRGRKVAPLLLFVLGLAIVFTALGAFSRVFVPVFRSALGQRIAGVVVVAIGLLMILYAFRIGGARIFAERRPFLGKVRPGTIGALPLGMAFATGWTPCVGPVLAGIIGLAGAQGGGVWGAFLMFCYALGLGLPFLLVGLGLQRLL
ncbi:MAG TPA: cytochrome c biogenesis protein CcdA, partial [Actinomycetota bacterium]|nr:cytochrome c biogenesis protein CcdA [Actinomycetota bacterium]